MHLRWGIPTSDLGGIWKCLADRRDLGGISEFTYQTREDISPFVPFQHLFEDSLKFASHGYEPDVSQCYALENIAWGVTVQIGFSY